MNNKIENTGIRDDIVLQSSQQNNSKSNQSSGTIVSKSQFCDVLDEVSSKALEDKLYQVVKDKQELFSSSQQNIDRFGIISDYYETNNGNNDLYVLRTTKYYQQYSGKKSNNKTQIYYKILNNIDPQKDRIKLKKMIREGIPEDLRSKNFNYQQKLQHYQKLLKETTDEATIIQINKDIDRTQPYLLFYRDTQSMSSLYNILKAYNNENKKLTYCQGMAFPASIFLYQLPELEAYYCYKAFMDKYYILYLGNLENIIKIQNVFEQLFQYTDKKMYKWIQDKNIQILIFIQKFLLPFFNQFQFNVQIRIFDEILSEGWKAIFRSLLALFKFSQEGKVVEEKIWKNKKFQKENRKKLSVYCLNDFGDIMIYLQGICKQIKNPDWWIKYQNKEIKFKTKYMLKLMNAQDITQ